VIRPRRWWNSPLGPSGPSSARTWLGRLSDAVFAERGGRRVADGADDLLTVGAVGRVGVFIPLVNAWNSISFGVPRDWGRGCELVLLLDSEKVSPDAQ
jgi:hypothetical protein